MKVLRWLLQRLVWIAVIVPGAFADDGDKCSVGVVASGGANLHNAAFGSFPGVQSCCSRYGWQWAPTVGIAAFIEQSGYRPASLPLSLQLRIGTTHLGGTLTRDEFIGNVIVGDSLVRGISRHRLEATLWALSIEPILRLNVFAHDAVAVELGGRVDWIPIAQYSQHEELIRPTTGVYFETQSPIRNRTSGPIPTAAPFGAALSAGVSYCIALDSTWTVRPELRGYLGMTRFADVPWYVHRIIAGIAVVRSAAQSRRVELPPPVQDIPPPPLAFIIQERLLGVHRRIGDTAVVEIPVRRVERRSVVMPVIFFPPQSAVLDSVAEAQIEAIARAIGRDRESVQLVPSVAPDEPDTLAIHRVRVIAERLRTRGINALPSPANGTKHAMISQTVIDELRAVWIKTTAPLILRESILVPLGEPTIAVLLTPMVSSSAGPVSVEISFQQDGQVTMTSVERSDPVHVQLSSARLLSGQPYEYRWSAVARDTAHQELERSGVGIVRPAFVEKDTTFESMQPGNALFLGRCAFDHDTFEEFDTTLAVFVRKAARGGKTIVLIGSTDTLGSERYNRALARRRAEAALQRLELPRESVRIEEQIGMLQERTLYQRIARRGVFVRIE